MTDRRALVAGFAVLVILGLLTAPPEARAQGIARIGLLGDLSWQPLKDGLRDLGYVEGKSVVFEERRAGGRSERWPELASDLVRLKVQVVVSQGTPATLAAKRATTSIPIVMAATGDPLSTGLVASLAQPGGNVTGLTQLGRDLAAKRIQLLREIVPNVSRLAFLWNPANLDQKSHVAEAQTIARALGITFLSVEVRRGEQLEPAFEAMLKDRPDALLMTGDSIHQLRIEWIIAFAAKHRVPAMYQLKDNVERGGLMSYGANYTDLQRRAAAYVDKILKGTRPSELPVEQPTTFEMAINLKTARALKLVIPPPFLLRANQVIE